MAINKDLLEIIACPQCKGSLELKENQTGFVCRSCKLVYRIEDDIPIMLIDEAEPLEE